ncbi:MAG TPA: alpha/beta fold hydrolase [Stellaceae bacterium]|jgi:3-oxoadipate enol-lactonase|nr:alpha/beta fold hydrolase [Stellaceae bacterium]
MSDVGFDPSRIIIHRKGSGPPLVLLHCLGVDHHLWDIAAAGLERDFTLVSFDFPGHGESPLPGRHYGIPELSGLAAVALAREGIDRAHVAGISLGGLVAQHFAATQPARVDRLMLLDTTPRYTDEMRAMWVARARQARTQGVASLLDSLLPVWFTPGFIAKDPPAVRYVRDCFAVDSGEGYALACEALGSADLRELVPKIAAPTLVVCGDEESPAFRDAAAFLAANISGATSLTLSPARHASILEQPAAFVTAAREFLLG